MLRCAAVLLSMSALCPAARDRVLIDADCAVFGDDGMAVVMLLRSPAQIEVAGITAVSGNVWSAQSAANLSHILELLKQRVPVHVGAETPLVHTAGMAAEQSRRWGKLAFTGAFADKPAVAGSRTGGVEFLISEIEAHPGEITVLALGPMTNIALALRLRPGLDSKIRRIVFMGGNVRVKGNVSDAAEFNFWFDPEAARIVLRSRIPQKVMFGLDICNLAPVGRPQFDELVAVRTPITGLIREDLGNNYPGFLKNPAAKSYMWDSLAAAYLLDPGFVTRTESMYLDVETTWGRAYGATVPLNRQLAPGATPVTVGLALDLPRVWTLTRSLATRAE